MSPEGQLLGMRLRSDRRPCYDPTFSAPKGISLLWALGPQEIHDAISVAHDHSVTAVLNQVSTEACHARRGTDSHRRR